LLRPVIKHGWLEQRFMDVVALCLLLRAMAHCKIVTWCVRVWVQC
jgi:hypothetical protein